MELSQGLDFIAYSSLSSIETLCDILPLELIQKALEQTDAVTLRKRKLPLESMVWFVIGMAIYNDKPLSQIIKC